MERWSAVSVLDGDSGSSLAYCSVFLFFYFYGLIGP